MGEVKKMNNNNQKALFISISFENYWLPETFTIRVDKKNDPMVLEKLQSQAKFDKVEFSSILKQMETASTFESTELQKRELIFVKYRRTGAVWHGIYENGETFLNHISESGFPLLEEERNEAEAKVKAEAKEKRARIFPELSKIVTEKYGEEVLKLALRKKGSVLAILKVLSESAVQIELAELEKIFGLTSSAPVIANLMACVAGEVDTFKSARVSEKAYAWAYLHNALPGVPFKGYFDDAKEALEIYSKNWR